ncbi:MAG TPA: hypothetical protein VJS64_08275 [Pyrinomonadaceae bacterium]|nr:hypothetical protein [Pyrinomonadaceae bacterium]
MVRVIAVLLLLVGLTVIALSLYSGFKSTPEPAPNPTPTPTPGPPSSPTPAPWVAVCVRATDQINEHYAPVRDAKTGQITDWKTKYYTPAILAGKHAMLVDGDVQERTRSAQPLYKLVWQSEDDPLLARHPMNKKSQHQWVVAHLVSIVNCSNIPPPTPTPTAAPKPTPGATPDNVPPSGFVSVLNAKVQELRFFECDFDMPERKQRVYARRFRAAESRYIGWELVLNHSRVPYTTAWDIRAVYFGDQGEFFRQEVRATSKDGWTNSFYNQSYGNRTPGAAWKPGMYRVDLWVENQKVASGTFEMF